MKVEIKRYTKQIARASNEIYLRTQQKQVTAKEKELLNEPKKLMGGVDPATWMLKQYKKSWINKLSYKKIKLQKMH